MWDDPHGFVQADWRPYLIADGKLHRHIWEIALAFAVRDALRAGSLFLVQSRDHVSFWSLVHDELHSVYATQAISCAPREARYVLSGILDNDSTLVIREHTSDTHGFTRAPVRPVRPARHRLHAGHWQGGRRRARWRGAA